MMQAAPRRRHWLWIWFLLVCVLAPPAMAETRGIEGPTPAFSNQFGGGTADLDDAQRLGRLPGADDDPALRSLWVEGMLLERDEKLLESARLYEVIVGKRPGAAHTYWRVARNYWRYGESLPFEDKRQRVRFFSMAKEWAQRGIDVDSECAECMLWKFVAMGRLATTRGLITAARTVDEMASLLDRGIELAPNWVDTSYNSTLGNLYYSGAVFFRVLPDWFWMTWFVGVRGDLGKSLRYIRRAVEISPVRVDYRVELGAVLLCLGKEKRKPRRTSEGIAVLRQARNMSPQLSTDHVDIAYAGLLIENPHKACGFSRDGFIDVDEVVASRRER